MPIKDPTIYPPYWKQFSLYIRNVRAKGRCEQCGIGNGFLKFTSKQAGNAIVDPSDDAALHAADAWYLDTKYRVTVIVLTVAHLDHADGPCNCKERTGRKCSLPDHVLALCQTCHLALDRQSTSRTPDKPASSATTPADSLFTDMEAPA